MAEAASILLPTTIMEFCGSWFITEEAYLLLLYSSVRSRKLLTSVCGRANAKPHNATLESGATRQKSFENSIWLKNLYSLPV